MNTTILSIAAPAPDEGGESLADKIKTALFQNDRLSSRPIAVSMEDNAVRLRGTVQSHRRREEAERTALSVCTEERTAMPLILNEIDVKLKQFKSDPELAEAARETLDENPTISRPALIVKTKAGVAEVRGNVRTHSERELVSDVLLALPGMRRVHNYLLVEPDLAERDRQDGERIRDWMNANSLLVDSRIRIGVADGRALLSGTAKRSWQRTLAERAVRELCPHIIRVDNSIRIAEAA